MFFSGSELFLSLWFCRKAVVTWWTMRCSYCIQKSIHQKQSSRTEAHCLSCNPVIASPCQQFTTEMNLEWENSKCGKEKGSDVVSVWLCEMVFLWMHCFFYSVSNLGYLIEGSCAVGARPLTKVEMQFGIKHSLIYSEYSQSAQVGGHAFSPTTIELFGKPVLLWGKQMYYLLLNKTRFTWDPFSLESFSDF